MEISKFTIIQDLNDSTGTKLVYSTLTTALITIDKETYHKVFELADYSDKELVNELKKMGILTDSHESQLKQLDEQRAKFMDLGHQHLTILTTTDCNARCFYCFEHGIKRVDMSKDVANATIQFIINTFPDKELSILWLGGEPLMNFDIIEYITKQLVHAGYTIITSVTTNGILLTQGMIDFFKHYSKLTTIQFSLDAAVGKDYYKVKRYVDFDENTAFKHVIDNIAMSLDNGLMTDVRFNFATSNIDNAKNAFCTVKQLLIEHDLTNAYLFLAPLDLPSSNEIVSDFHGNIEHPYLQVVKFQKEMGFPIRAELQKDHGDILASYALMPTCYICGMTTKHKYVIDSDGMLYKCHRFAGHHELNCGNVFDGINIDSKSYKQFRETTILDEQCKICPILPICQSGCIAKRVLLGESQKCHKIKQIQKELVRLCFNESIKS